MPDMEAVFTYRIDLIPLSGNYRFHKENTRGHLWHFMWYTQPYLHNGKWVWVAEEQRQDNIGKPIMAWVVTRRRWFNARWKAKDCAWRWACRRTGKTFRTQHTKRTGPIPAAFERRKFQRSSLEILDE